MFCILHLPYTVRDGPIYMSDIIRPRNQKRNLDEQNHILTYSKWSNKIQPQTSISVLVIKAGHVKLHLMPSNVWLNFRSQNWSRSIITIFQKSLQQVKFCTIRNLATASPLAINSNNRTIDTRTSAGSPFLTHATPLISLSENQFHGKYEVSQYNGSCFAFRARPWTDQVRKSRYNGARYWETAKKGIKNTEGADIVTDCLCCENFAGQDNGSRHAIKGSVCLGIGMRSEHTLCYVWMAVTGIAIPIDRHNFNDLGPFLNAMLSILIKLPAVPMDISLSQCPIILHSQTLCRPRARQRKVSRRTK